MRIEQYDEHGKLVAGLKRINDRCAHVAPLPSQATQSQRPPPAWWEVRAAKETVAALVTSTQVAGLTRLSEHLALAVQALRLTEDVAGIHECRLRDEARGWLDETTCELTRAALADVLVSGGFWVTADSLTLGLEAV